MPEDEDAIIQLICLEITKGNKRNPLSKKVVRVRAGSPVSLRKISADLGDKVTRKTLTRAIQERYLIQFGN